MTTHTTGTRAEKFAARARRARVDLSPTRIAAAVHEIDPAFLNTPQFVSERQPDKAEQRSLQDPKRLFEALRKMPNAVAQEDPETRRAEEHGEEQTRPAQRW